MPASLNSEYRALSANRLAVSFGKAIYDSVAKAQFDKA
jgi:hypothetical protein